MIHIYLVKEEELHNLSDLGSTCNCGTRVIILDGEMVCVHSVLDNSHPFSDEFVEDAFYHNDEGGDIPVEDVE